MAFDTTVEVVGTGSNKVGVGNEKLHLRGDFDTTVEVGEEEGSDNAEAEDFCCIFCSNSVVEYANIRSTNGDREFGMDDCGSRRVLISL